MSLEPSDAPSIECSVASIIRTQFLIDTAGMMLTPTVRLIDDGILDSVGIVHLVANIEMQFGIRVEDHELLPRHFATLNDIVALIVAKERARHG